MGVFLHEAFAAACPKREAEARAADNALGLTIAAAVARRMGNDGNRRAEAIIRSTEVAFATSMQGKKDSPHSEWLAGRAMAYARMAGDLTEQVKTLCAELATFDNDTSPDPAIINVPIEVDGVELVAQVDNSTQSLRLVAVLHRGADMTDLLHSRLSSIHSLACHAIDAMAAKSRDERWLS